MSSPTVSKTSGQPIVGAVGSGAGGAAGVNGAGDTFDTAPAEPPAVGGRGGGAAERARHRRARSREWGRGADPGAAILGRPPVARRAARRRPAPSTRSP